MRKAFHHIFFYTALVVVLFSCSKGGATADDTGAPHVATPDDTTAPDISILTPTLNQVFANGTIINITGKITDDYGLYRGTIRVINDANGNVLMNQAYEIHGFLSYTYSINHSVSALTASDYTISVSFEDHGSNTTTKSVKVKVTP